MKAPFNQKILILALASIVIAGTGCERRGRVPPKDPADMSAGGGNTVKNPTGEKPAGEAPAGETKVEETKVEKEMKTSPVVQTLYSSDEKNLITDAKLNSSSAPCAISINPTGEPSLAQFAKDYASLEVLKNCMSKNGVQFAPTSENPTWLILSSPERQANSRQNSPMLTEFDLLVGKDNEDKAAKILEARTNLYIHYIARVVEKFDLKLSGQTEYSVPGSSNTQVGHFVQNLADQRKALEAAFGGISSMQRVSKGADLAEDSEAKGE